MNSKEHYFLLEDRNRCGSKDRKPAQDRTREASEQEQAAALIERAAQSMGRKLDTTGIKELLYSNLEHPTLG